MVYDCHTNEIETVLDLLLKKHLYENIKYAHGPISIYQ